MLGMLDGYAPHQVWEKRFLSENFCVSTMAPKNLSALEKDKSEEEESSSQEESEEEEEESSSSEENSNQKLQNPKTPKPPSSSSQEEDDDDDDDEEEKEEEDVPTNTSKNQQEEAKHTPKTALQVQKVDDQMEDPTTENTKFIRQKGEGEDSKAAAAAAAVVNSFARVWSEADEISILKGMIDYQNQKGVNPHADMSAFHEFVKGRFGFEVTKSQLSDKVRRLKRKFFNNVKKVSPNLSRPHDASAFKLSKKIWGTTNANNQENVVVDENDGKAKKRGKVKSFEGNAKEHDKKNEEVEGMEVDFSGKYPYLVESFDADIFPMSKSERKFMKRHIGLIDSEKAMEFEENWKRLRMEEIEFFCRRSQLMIKQTKSVMRAVRKR